MAVVGQARLSCLRCACVDKEERGGVNSSLLLMYGRAGNGPKRNHCRPYRLSERP